MSKEISAYYDSTKNRAVRADLEFAAGLLRAGQTALDCGCGAGPDIAYLREQGFFVHAFDSEEAAISICKDRFGSDPGVCLTQTSFSDFEYPSASLIVADASLFFCPPTEFERVWTGMKDALEPGGLFCGSFLGPRDTMAGPEYQADAFWPDVMVFTEAEVRGYFSEFEILKWTEHEVDGETAVGKPHHWHIFSLVARFLGGLSQTEKG